MSRVIFLQDLPFLELESGAANASNTSLVAEAVGMKKYTDEETEFLARNYRTMTRNEIMQIVHHTWPSIKTKARTLDICRRMRNWMPLEDEILRDSYASGSKREIVARLGRDWGGIKIRAWKLGLRREHSAIGMKSVLERRPLLDLSEPDKAWIAAAIDFEGTIGFHHDRGTVLTDRYRPYVAMSNTKIELCQRFVSILRLPTKLDYRDFSKNPRYRPAWMARTNDTGRVYSILERVKPLLIAKRPQADCVMEFLEIQEQRYEIMRLDGLIPAYTERQLELVQTVHNLNKKGR